MILTGPEIAARVRAGNIHITPFDARLVNPASYDVTLGPNIVTYEAQNGGIVDPEQENECRRDVIGLGRMGDAILLQPGRLYLLHTIERVWTPDLVTVLDGKSSLGRLGVSVHQTAGYGDPGFDGQYTMEVTVIMTTRLRVGMRIGQLRFHTTVGEVRTYRGKYQADFAQGAVEARPEKLEP